MTNTPGKKLGNALPAWPAGNDSNLFWIGLSCRFRYHNQPKLDYHSNPGDDRGDFYCHPRDLIEKIRGFLEESNGGSIMVTGYRGTGKTSLVAESIREVQSSFDSRPPIPGRPEPAPADRENDPGLSEQTTRAILQVRVNLSTVSTPQEVLVLSIESLTRTLRDTDPWKQIRGKGKGCRDYDDLLRDFDRVAERIKSSRVEKHIPGASPDFHRGSKYSDPVRGHEESTFQSEAISSAQASFRDLLGSLRERPFKVEITEKDGTKRVEWFEIPMIIFVFDEIDKFRSLGRTAGEEGEPSRIVQLQTIVARLKSFLAEASSHQIFVAGKDADDNWAEDQNKGEGVLESLFAANVYVPSVLSIGQLNPSRKDQRAFFGNKVRPANLERIPCLTRDLYNLMAREIGISEKSMSYLTCFLIFPYLAEYEVYQLLKRIAERHREEEPAFLGRKKILNVALRKLRRSLKNTKFPGKCPRDLPPMSERTCRRLRTLMEYLTYKGRGIPRKILRELYSMVQPAPSNTPDPDSLAKLYIRHQGLMTNADGTQSSRPGPTPLNIIALPGHQIQRMSFYASIMDTLDQSFNEFSGMIDKQRVAIFHIVDHILKFYSTGFNRQDIEHASFMTIREEIYPGRPLAMTILRIMEGKLWKRRTLSGEEFRLLHYVNHDLGVLFLRYAPEQMELRHTTADFRHELPSLEAAINAPAGMKSYHAQMRKGRISELVGSHHEARLAYHRTLEWIRTDLGALWAARDTNPMFPFTEPLVAHAIDCLLALGRLHEEVSENSDAVRIYEEIEHLYQSYTRQEEKSRLCMCVGSCKCGASSTSPPNKNVSKSLDGSSGKPRERKEEDKLLETLLPEDLARGYLPAMRLLLERTPPVNPSSLKAADTGLVRSYNQAALCYAKMSERTSGNERLLRALFHLDRIGDEQGMIDQMVLIAHVLLRRRDLRSASRWYLAALGRIRRISLYANREGGSDRQRVREQTGAEWQTPAIHKSTEAQIWAYLGDICHATNGIAFLDDITVPPLQEEVEKKLISIVRHLGFPVYEDRVFEYFSTAARHRFQEMGDRDSAMNVLLRQLEFRMRQLRRSVYRLAGDPKPSPAQSIAILFDFLATWRGFWKSSRLALDSQYITPNSLSRDREHFRGRPVDNRLIGNASRLIGEFLRESSLHIATFQEVFQKQDKPGQGTRHWRGITPDQLEKEGARRSKWLKGKFRTNHLKHVKEIASGEASRSGFKHYCAIMGQILNVWHLEQPVGDPFAAGGMLDRRENDLPRKRGLASPLYRVNTGSDRDPAGDGSELVIESVRRKVWDILERSGTDEASAGPLGLLLDQLSVLSAAEAAVLHGYLYHRDSMMDFEQAMTTMEACSVYHSALYLVELAFEPGGAFSLAGLPREDLYELQDVLHEVAKRFAVNTVDVLKREREQNRNTYTLLSEAYFGLGEILLFRIRRHLADEGSSKAKEMEPPPKAKPQASAKSDVVLGDLWRQAWSAFRDGLNCILMEIEDLDHRYRLPVEVNHASGNLMDPVLHFRICRSVGQRHASFRTVRMQNSEVEQVISEINSTLSEVMPYDPAKEAWLPALATRVELASRLRTDRPTLEIISPSSQSSSGEAGAGAQAPLQICCVALKDFGRQKRSGKPQQRFAYFGPVNPADRSAPAAAPATAADRFVAAS